MQVVLIQVALSTAEETEEQSAVSDLVTRINSQYATLAYQPIVFLHQDISYYMYIALLEIADALVITSLREGMNLTSHEYVICQEKRNCPLILSEFTGSAACFNRAQITVNPWDIEQIARAFNLSLTMPPAERLSRWKVCYCGP